MLLNPNRVMFVLVLVARAQESHSEDYYWTGGTFWVSPLTSVRPKNFPHSWSDQNLSCFAITYEGVFPHDAVATSAHVTYRHSCSARNSCIPPVFMILTVCWTTHLAPAQSVACLWHVGPYVYVLPLKCTRFVSGLHSAKQAICLRNS